jgi:hypothetical protein
MPSQDKETAMRLVILMLCLIMSTGSSYALCWPDATPDVIGLYFDDVEWINCIGLGQFSQAAMYLLLTNPTAQDSITGWECRLEFPDDVIVGPVTIHGGGLDIQTGPEYRIQLSEPLPVADTVVLASTGVLNMTGRYCLFYVRPVADPTLPNAACYWTRSAPDAPIALRSRYGNWDWPSAWTDYDCCGTPTAEPSAWGRLKALYGSY